MSFSDFLDHTCSIYHLQRGEDKDLGYGLRGEPSFDYPSEPDILNVACHFNSTSSNMTQKEPNNDLDLRTKLNLPVGTDLRLLDKVVWREKGLEFTVISKPRTVHGHHVYAYVERGRVQKPL